MLSATGPPLQRLHSFLFRSCSFVNCSWISPCIVFANFAMLHFLSLLIFCHVFADGSCKLVHPVGLPLRLRGQHHYNLHFENWGSFVVLKL